jgi:outer membrane protein OmpA-like peptidoglycan-associated protein
MFSQDDDSAQRVALFLVFGLIAIVVASVLVFGVNHRGVSAKGAGAPAAQVAAAPGVADDPAPSSATAQAASDAASVKVEQGIVKFYFASGKADLAAGASEALIDVVKGAQAGRKVAISGFHDATGNAAQNAELAKQRALAVRNALTAAGVPESQIELKKPEQIAGNAAGSNAEARRVEISLQ